MSDIVERLRFDIGNVCGGPPSNPLQLEADDGDALRLLLKLQLKISYEPYCKVRIWGEGVSVTEFWGAVGIEAATRRAIVRAAAEIGKNMK